MWSPVAFLWIVIVIFFMMMLTIFVWQTRTIRKRFNTTNDQLKIAENQLKSANDQLATLLKDNINLRKIYNITYESNPLEQPEEKLDIMEDSPTPIQEAHTNLLDKMKLLTPESNHHHISVLFFENMRILDVDCVYTQHTRKMPKGSNIYADVRQSPNTALFSVFYVVNTTTKDQCEEFAAKLFTDLCNIELPSADNIRNFVQNLPYEVSANFNCLFLKKKLVGPHKDTIITCVNIAVSASTEIIILPQDVPTFTVSSKKQQDIRVKCWDSWWNARQLICLIADQNMEKHVTVRLSIKILKEQLHKMMLHQSGFLKDAVYDLVDNFSHFGMWFIVLNYSEMYEERNFAL